MTLVVDASVAFKWVHADDEREVDEARALLATHARRQPILHLLDLTPYEVANALSMRGGTVERIRDALALLVRTCDVVAPDQEDLGLAAALAIEHRLSLYDAAYAAVARRRGWTLVTADTALLEAGLGISPTEAASHLDR